MELRNTINKFSQLKNEICSAAYRLDSMKIERDHK